MFAPKTLSSQLKCQRSVAAARQAVGSGSGPERLKHPSFTRTASVTPTTTPPIHWEDLWPVPNPFMPWRHPKNGKFFQPKYSLRRQIQFGQDLCDTASPSARLKTPMYVPQPVETPAPTPDVAETSAGATEEYVTKEEDVD